MILSLKTFFVNAQKGWILGENKHEEREKARGKKNG